MSSRTARRISWLLFAISLSLAGLSLLFEVLSRSVISLTEDSASSPPDVIAAIAFPFIGALVASRRPGNSVGWIMCAVGFFSALNVFANAYSTYTLLARPGALPGGAATAWLQTWTWAPSLGLFPLLFLLFPTGALPSRRWRPVAWLASGAVALSSLIVATLPYEETVPHLPLQNPVGIELPQVLETVLYGAWVLSLFVGLIASVASVFVRFRRAHGEERAQLKWVAYAAAVFFASLLVNLYLSNVLGFPGAILPSVAYGAVPVALGVAILRYRLYEIDLIINRTLVYGLLTAVLAGIYAAGVVGLGGALRELANQENNNLAVAASTLAVAALFRPARTRIQSFIDRRFYRARYDATKTLERFSSRLRDEVDIDALTVDLVGVVRETMQPAHVSLWLQDGTAATVIHGRSS